jgi:dTDP-4-amino-4,6-dideoxygalactose transaminase
MIPYVELKSQFKSIEEEVRAAIDEVLESSWYVLGAQVRAFEEEFAAYLGAKHTVGVASGTDAIQLALMACGVGPGDEVITVANTCVPTVCGISNSGADIALVDIRSNTLTMDPACLESAITSKTKAIVPVHLYGHPCDMDPILDIAKEHDLVVVEDCAQAHGTEYKGRRCGTLGHAAAFSFYPSKNLGAYGDGGAVVTQDTTLAEEVRKLRNYGEERRYFHSVKGINSRLDEMQAAILRVKLRHLDGWNEARRDRARIYDEKLTGLELSLPVQAPWAKHIYHLYVIRSPRRDALQAHLKEQGVGSLIHYPIPIHKQGAYPELGGQCFAETEKACSEVLSLPMFPELDLGDLERVADIIQAFPS